MIVTSVTSPEAENCEGERWKKCGGDTGESDPKTAREKGGRSMERDSGELDFKFAVDKDGNGWW